MIDITNKRFMMFGPPGGGKSNLVRHILRTTRQHIVWDPLNDYAGFNQYRPSDPHSKLEAEEWARKMVVGWKPRLAVMEEANNIVEPKPKPLIKSMRELNDWSRHYGIAWGLVARKPVQLNNDCVDLAHYIFSFRLTGTNDRRWFDNYYQGLGDVVATLPKYHFVVIEPGETPYIHNPVPDTSQSHISLGQTHTNLTLDEAGKVA